MGWCRLPPGLVRLVEVVLAFNMAVIAIIALNNPLVLIERFNGIYNYTSDGNASNPCQNATNDDLAVLIEQRTSSWMWYIKLSSLLPAVPITAILFGPWSDKYGRRPIILLGSIGNLIAVVTMLLFHVYQLPFYILIVSSVVQALTGGQSATIGMSFAYISDVSTRDQRTARLTVLEATVFLSSGIGYAVGSSITQHFKTPGVSLSVASGLLVLQILYIVLILKEGERMVQQQNQFTQEFTQDGANTDTAIEQVRKHLNKIKHVYFEPSEHRLDLWVLFTTLCLLMLVLLGSETADFLFMRLRPFCLSEQHIGYVTITKSVGFGAYAFISAAVAKRLGLQDVTMALFGLACFAGSKVMFAFSFDAIFLFAAAAVSMPMVVADAIYRSMMSKLVDSSYQGTLFSVVAGFEGLSSALGTVIYNECFKVFSSYSHLPGVTQPAGYMYFVTAAILIPCPFALLFVHYRRKGKSSGPRYMEVPGSDPSSLQMPDVD